MNFGSTDYRSGKRCYNWTAPDGLKVHIPGCWGCVIRGHEIGCTCRSPKQEDALDRLNMLERRVKELELDNARYRRIDKATLDQDLRS